jgi:hypothetical protein
MKYNIEDGLNFYDKLKQSIDTSPSNDTNDILLCLISNTPLETHFFTFECGHKFNYIPLFHDIYNHKIKYNSMENSKGKLKMNEIRCPFCRNKQSGVLPYYSDLEFEQTHGVNYIDSNIVEDINGFTYYKCKFKTNNSLFNINDTDSENNVKDILCNSYADVITPHICFCYKHFLENNKIKKIAEKETIQIAKLAEKEAIKIAKLAKLAEKEAIKIAKLAEKEAIKIAKLAEKEAIKIAKLAEKEAIKIAKIPKKIKIMK